MNTPKNRRARHTFRPTDNREPIAVETLANRIHRETPLQSFKADQRAMIHAEARRSMIAAGKELKL
ncbi:hypothetical protein ACIQYW_19085 [Rhodococcus erythropolis]|uniref:hypothetical protein n=1 Tax=Actinomycetes TaxID=1760 RepID=UPI0003900CEC|nr:MULTISPECIES: hypothetical protein [Rhodococcus]ERB53479.1 hypothetical protein N806_20265 [Rhodococcus sp. P27]MBQ7803665.1 hypothetical protein [Rhodococcus sp. (in: high G+C Gram-positive bacteria)]